MPIPHYALISIIIRIFIIKVALVCKVVLGCVYIFNANAMHVFRTTGIYVPLLSIARSQAGRALSIICSDVQIRY